METNTILLLIISVLIAAGLAFFQYIYKAKNKSNLNLFLAFLRFITFFGLFILIINPTVTRNTFKTEKTPLVIVMDNSSSIPFLNANKEALASYQKLVNHPALQEKFEIQSYQLDSDLQLSNSFNFKGKQTNLEAAARLLQKNYKNKSFPTLLLTDGNQTNGNEYEFSFDPLNKVFPIVLGDTTKVTDLKITQVNVNKYAFYKNQFPVEIFAAYSGKEAITANFKIFQGKSILVNQIISFSPQKKTAVVQVVLPANKIGLQLYKAQIIASKKEKNPFNNTSSFAVEVMDQKTEIALLSAINHPDIGALKRTIESNVQRKVTVIKPQYINELKNYKLVIFYQPNKQFNTAFETTKQAGLNSFIITGTSTDYSFLNQQQSDVVFKMSNQMEDYFANFNSQFTLFSSENIGFESFPPLQNSFGTINAKGNSSVLLSSKIRGIDTESPMLVFSENQGKRTTYLFGENSWKWRAHYFIENQNFEKYDTFIDKIIQYLSTNSVKQSLVVEHQLIYNLGDPIEISAYYLNKNFEFDEKARFEISIVNTTSKMNRKYDFSRASNSFKVNLESLPAGKYNFTITELNSKERYSNTLEILDFDVEKQFVNPDEFRLQQLANYTKGSLFYPDKTDQLIHKLLAESEYQSIQKEVVIKSPLIEWVSLLIFLLFILSLEWFVRKYNGLL